MGLPLDLGLVREGERLETLQYGDLRILQKEKAFHYGTDAVLLADFAAPRARERMLDLGTGTGVIALLMASRQENARCVALEIQPEMADMAARSVHLNALQERIEVRCADFCQAHRELGCEKYTLAVCNPPYGKAGSVLLSQTEPLRIARHEVACTLEQVVEMSAYLLKPGGKLFLVHRPERLVDIFTSMRENKIEPKRMQMVHPSAGKKANIVLVEGVYMGGRELKLLAPLYVYDENGRYTKQIDDIYERGCK